mgnify:CR=1 FL=1
MRQRLRSGVTRREGRPIVGPLSVQTVSAKAYRHSFYLLPSLYEAQIKIHFASPRTVWSKIAIHFGLSKVVWSKIVIHFGLHTASKVEIAIHFWLHTASKIKIAIHFWLHTASKVEIAIHFGLHTASKVEIAIHFGLHTASKVKIVIHFGLHRHSEYAHRRLLYASLIFSSLRIIFVSPISETRELSKVSHFSYPTQMVGQIRHSFWASYTHSSSPQCVVIGIHCLA